MINHAMQRIRALEDRLSKLEELVEAGDGVSSTDSVPSEPKARTKTQRPRKKRRVLPRG